MQLGICCVTHASFDFSRTGFSTLPLPTEKKKKEVEGDFWKRKKEKRAWRNCTGLVSVQGVLAQVLDPAAPCSWEGEAFRVPGSEAKYDSVVSRAGRCSVVLARR